MRRAVIFAILFGALALTACQSSDRSKARERMEKRGAEILVEAREAFAAHDFDGVRSLLQTLRKECPLAFDARNAGILLTDSVNMQEALLGMVATDSVIQSKGAAAGDSLTALLEEYDRKFKFYRRKLAHDRDTLQRK